MKLHIENFAKIANADIEINGITVIAGENNTGKSTVGKVLYSLYQSFHNLPEQVTNERMKSLSRALRKHTNIMEKIDFFSGTSPYQKLLLELLKSGLEGYENVLNNHGISYSEKLSSDIVDSFYYDSKKIEEQIVNKTFNFEFNYQPTPAGLNKANTVVDLSIKNKDTNEIEKINLFFLNNGLRIIKKIDLYKKPIYIDNPFVIDNLSKNTDTDSENQMDIFELLNMRQNVYTHNDVLKKMLSKSTSNINESLIEKSKIEDRLNKFIKRMQDTLQGDIIEKENRFVFYDRTSNCEIELGNLSTGIKMLTILLKLIESHDISDNSMIALDEPEIHLHPKWQIIFAEILVLLQKEFNLNIVLTSHSPYFINAIEVYSAKYEIADKCKYYLSDLNDNNMAVFKDVTRSTDKIYKKLAAPLQTLANIEAEVMGNG